jgi:hypothetical protein
MTRSVRCGCARQRIRSASSTAATWAALRSGTGRLVNGPVGRCAAMVWRVSGSGRSGVDHGTADEADAVDGGPVDRVGRAVVVVGSVAVVDGGRGRDRIVAFDVRWLLETTTLPARLGSRVARRRQPITVQIARCRPRRSCHHASTVRNQRSRMSESVIRSSRSIHGDRVRTGGDAPYGSRGSTGSAVVDQERTLTWLRRCCSFP